MRQDTTTEIWDRRFMVKLPTIAASSKSFLKNHGTYLTGDPHVDKSAHADMIVTYLNIDRMLEYWRDGVPICLMKPSDSKAIYDAIERHILAWIDHLQFGLNTADAPIRDLIDLDNFASVVYPHAKKHISEAMLNNILGRRIEDRFGFTAGNFLKPTAAMPVPEAAPERTPFSDFLKTQLDKRRI